MFHVKLVPGDYVIKTIRKQIVNNHFIPVSSPQNCITAICGIIENYADVIFDRGKAFGAIVSVMRSVTL